MRFPRTTKIFRGQFDATPFAAVFFLLVMFLLLASLIYTPGVRIKLPVAADLPGVDGPTLTVAVDFNGQFYFRNQVISEAELLKRLSAEVGKSQQPITLIVQADESVRSERLLRLSLLARDAGIREASWATLPKPFESSTRP